MTCLNSIRIESLLLMGAYPVFASLMLVGPVTLDRDIPSFPTTLSIQNVGTASGCVGFLDGETLTGLSACPGGFTGVGGSEILGPDRTASPMISQLAAAGIASAADLLFV